MKPHDDELTPDEVAELGALLVAERPRPSAAFAARLDARVTERFVPAPAPPRVRRTWRSTMLPAAAALAVALAALVVVVGNDGGRPAFDGGAATSAPGSAPASGPAGRSTFEDRSSSSSSAELDAPAPSAGSLGAVNGTRKVERSASVELGADADRVDDVAQDVLGVVARFDGIVDQSSVASDLGGGVAQFELRVPAARLQEALAALSRLPAARVLARSDQTLDVNQAYVSIRRRLANARAERAGVVRALQVADTEGETLRLRDRLAALESTIALAERSQRALDRRVDYSRVTVSVHADNGAGGGAGGPDDGLTIGGAFDDAGRVLEVAAAVAVIAAAALVPFAVLLACGWPLARALTRRRREQALDAV